LNSLGCSPQLDKMSLFCYSGMTVISWVPPLPLRTPPRDKSL
jgi:hypothetical protein